MQNDNILFFFISLIFNLLHFIYFIYFVSSRDSTFVLHQSQLYAISAERQKKKLQQKLQQQQK